MKGTINQAKEEYLRAKGRMTHTLATTPDDKINWSPSATARTPIQQVAHCANATARIVGMLSGKPFPFASVPESDTAMRTEEKKFTTREQVLERLEQTSAEYLAWLDGVTSDRFIATVQLPFGPSFPMAVALTFPAVHMREHIAQMEYIQTIYGDQDYHIENSQ